MASRSEYLQPRLEIARAGAVFGASARVEPPIEGSHRSADVELTVNGQLVTVQTTSFKVGVRIPRARTLRARTTSTQPHSYLAD
jgi:hypothetical protein